MFVFLNQFRFSFSFFNLAGNGSGIAAVGDFQHQSSIDVLPFV
jgi:hypothetical protein